MTVVSTFPYTFPLMDSDSTFSLQQQAIAAALTSNWKLALALNEQILEVEPKSVDALNRLARACFELGKLNNAKKYYEKALSLDPYNQIAAKFLKRIASLKKGIQWPKNGSNLVPISSDLFIKEPGKTKLISLLKVAEPQKLSLLSTGSEVLLKARKHTINITDQSGSYLGVLPDDLAHHLTKFIKGGNRYSAYIKSIKPNAIAILIKEEYRCSRFKNQPSFPDTTTNFTYSSDHINLQEDEYSDEETSELEQEERVV